MEDYIFIYRDTLGWYDLCTNPVFIAKAQQCRAFKKSELRLDKDNLIKLLNTYNKDDIPVHYRNYINDIRKEFWN